MNCIVEKQDFGDHKRCAYDVFGVLVSLQSVCSFKNRCLGKKERAQNTK